MTLLQWTRYAKTIRDHEETIGTTKKKPARVFWCCWPSTLLSILCFCFLQKKHCFSPENGLFCSFLSVSLSFALASFTFPFSLSVSLYFFLVFFVSSFLVDFFLPCCFVVLSCLVSLRLFTKKITFQRLLFINYFCFLGVSFFALPFKSLLLILFVCFFFSCVFWST